MAKKAPGKAHREGLTVIELMDMYPTEEAATAWFESIVWPDGRHCPKCGSIRTREASHAKMPCWCTDCRSYFSVKTGTAMQRSKIPLRKWAIAIYLCLTSLKSVSSMKLRRDIGVSQPTAWFMLHRIRVSAEGTSASDTSGGASLAAPVPGHVSLSNVGEKQPLAGPSPVLRERLNRSGRTCPSSRFRRLPTPEMRDPAMPVRRPTHSQHRPAPAPPPGVRPMSRPRPLLPKRRPQATSACHAIHTCPVSVRSPIGPGSRTA